MSDFVRLTAADARSLVEAHRLNLDEFSEVLVPIYEEINRLALEGKTQFERPLIMVCAREQVGTVIQVLREDGYIVGVDNGILIITWGRPV